MKINNFSHLVTVFQDRLMPEEGYLAGYDAIIKAYDLEVPKPDLLSIISHKHRQYKTESWQVFTPRHKPEDTLIGHLTFALKYEGIELYLLKKLFETIDAEELAHSIAEEPNGLYRRRIWFLYEWLMEVPLDLQDLTTGNYIDLVDVKIQYGITSGLEIIKRQRVRNNLPGTKAYCPMIRKTEKLTQFMALKLSRQIKDIIGVVHPDMMARTASFLLLKDSKASYAIEGERPPQSRAQRWGRAIGQAGHTAITIEELSRLQHIVIDNPRFTTMGLRKQEGFIGEHDRHYGTPIPDHISARWKDVEDLVTGLISTSTKLENDPNFDAVLAATLVAFGFVFIHPFEDGNGRIHRYLIHHVLLRKDYVSKGIIFPVSSIILERLDEYRQVLETFSILRIDIIEWRPDGDNNVEILNETADLYRYFDATKQAEFLYDCVRQTIEHTIPEEVDYLKKYDLMKDYLDNTFEMPGNTIALLIRFIEQSAGKLSERAKSKEFSVLTAEEVVCIEERYQKIFGAQNP